MDDIQKVEENEIKTVDNANLNEDTETTELEISFEGESLTPNEDDEFDSEENDNQTEVFKNLRNKYKDTSKELKSLRRELELLKTKPQEQQKEQEENLTIPSKPKLEDFDYDEDKFNEALDSWVDKKLEIDTKRKAIERKKQDEANAWNEKVANYNKEKRLLSVPDYDASESMVKTKLTEIQQGIILDAVKNPAQFVYAIGKSSKLEELSKIENPIIFAAEVSRLETQLKVNNKTKTPPPVERKINGGNGSVNDTKLSKLREEALKSGDWTNYIKEKNKKG